MNEHAELKELLKNMEEANKKQVFYAKIQCIFSVIAAVCCVAVLFLGLKFMPQIQTLADQANAVLSNLEAVTEDLAEVDLSGLEYMINELSKADLSSMVDNIDELVKASQEGVEGTMEKLNEINFATLNKTIEDLSKVVERLAKIASIFG